MITSSIQEAESLEELPLQKVDETLKDADPVEENKITNVYLLFTFIFVITMFFFKNHISMNITLK